MNQLLIKLYCFLIIFNLFPQLLKAQCILGDIEVCSNNSLMYHSGYVDDPSNPVITWTWTVSDPLKAKIIRTNIDTLELEFLVSGHIDLQLQMLTEMGTLINCDLNISVLENQDFDINMTTTSGCKPYVENIENGITCKGNYSTFTTLEHFAYLHYWVYKNQSIGSGGESDPVLFEETGHDTITLVSVNTINGCSRSFIYIVKVIDIPDSEIGYVTDSIMSDTFCAMQRLRFINKSQNTGIVLYKWEVRKLSNNQLLYTQSSTDPKEDLVFQFVDSGNYKIILNAIDQCGCSSQDEKTLNIREGVGITVECPSVVCSDSLREVSYIAEDSCASYSWQVIGGILTYQNHNMIRVKWTESPPSGFGYIKLTTTGCSGDLCEGITIIEVPILNAYAEIKGQTYICEKTGLFAYSVPSWPGASYQWSLSPSDTSELQILSGDKSPQVIVALDDYTGTFDLTIVCRQSNLNISLSSVSI